MKTTETRELVKQYMEIGFTMKESFDAIRSARTKTNRKNSIVAESRAKAVEEGRREEFNLNEYYKNKR